MHGGEVWIREDDLVAWPKTAAGRPVEGRSVTEKRLHVAYAPRSRFVAGAATTITMKYTPPSARTGGTR